MRGRRVSGDVECQRSSLVRTARKRVESCATATRGQFGNNVAFPGGLPGVSRPHRRLEVWRVAPIHRQGAFAGNRPFPRGFRAGRDFTSPTRSEHPACVPRNRPSRGPDVRARSAP